MTKFALKNSRISQYSSNAPENSSPIQAGYSRSIYLIFLFFALYLALPVVDVPLLGLSLSAPVFFLVALPVFLRPPRPWLADYRNWIMLATAIWLGIFLSAVFVGLVSGGVRIDQRGWLSLVRFAYWLLAFVVTTYLVSSQPGWGGRLVAVLAIGITILSLLRLSEAVFGGAIGAWASLQWMAQNAYGIQFSIFFPLLLSCLYWGRYRGPAAFAALLVLAAIGINGSRSNWLATLSSTLVFLFILLRHYPQRLRSVVILLLLIGILGLFVSFAPFLLPADVLGAFEQRLGTFENLEQDKSYMIRQLMVQKGLGLFQENPLFGVGISRWTRESIPLELPSVLAYAPQSYFDNRSSHNSYLSFLAETGLAGGLPFALLLLILAVNGYRAAARLTRRGDVWAAGIYAGFIGMSIHLWSLSGLTGTVPWFMYGLVAALIVLERQISSQTLRNFDVPRLSLSRLRRF